MKYEKQHIGAVVGQLKVLLEQFQKGHIEPRQWDECTSYTLSRITGFSRYHVVNICEIAVDNGLVSVSEKPHRPNVSKVCYKVTKKGIRFVEQMVQDGIYQDCVELIVRNHHLRTIARVDYAGSFLETRIYSEKGIFDA